MTRMYAAAPTTPASPVPQAVQDEIVITVGPCSPLKNFASTRQSCMAMLLIAIVNGALAWRAATTPRSSLPPPKVTGTICVALAAAALAGFVAILDESRRSLRITVTPTHLHVRRDAWWRRAREWSWRRAQVFEVRV